MSTASSLLAEMRSMIETDGPLSVERFMALALGHPRLGYYMTRDPLGAQGDFTTAPEISQMFGELLGLWAAAVWVEIGRPDPVRLVELGPGRGTLMADALRAARSLPAFHAALDVHLVETSPVLRDIQRRTLAPCGRRVTWHQGVETLASGPSIVLANEFFDALPVRHYLRTAAGWCERCVGTEGDGLVFGVRAVPEPSIRIVAPEGSLIEVGLVARQLAGRLAAHLVAHGGAALIVDYGYAGARLGETLQAVRAHRPVDPLEQPGQADLTVHVDFAALAQAAQAAGASAWGPVSQRDLLLALGIEARAAALKARANGAQAAALDAALDRLLDTGVADRPGMGHLFKALALSAHRAPPPGFATTTLGDAA